MTTIEARLGWRGLPWRAVTGPAVAGACLGLGTNLATTLRWAGSLPLFIVTLAVMTLPALYIATSLAGEAPAFGRVVGAALDALDDAGLVMLGLAPALAFLVVTTQNAHTIDLALLVVAVPMLLGLRSLFLTLFASERPLTQVASRTVLTYVVWSAVALGIGYHWLATRAAATLGGLP